METSANPGTHGTGSARKLAVVSKAHGLELGHFSTRNNFHSEVLRRKKIFALTYVDRIILAKTAQLLRNSSSLRSQSYLSL
jgi:hypothetical protein